MSQWGDTLQPPDPDEPPPLGAEHGWLAVGIAAAAGFAVAYIVDQTDPVDINHGAYIAAAAVFLAGVAGYLVRSAERHVRQDAAGRQVRGRLAELTSQVDQLRKQIAGRPACRAAGHMHVSQPSQPPVGCGPASVDAATDPAGSALQRAREVGIEEGFDLGLKVKLADLGVPTLPRPRRPRLTGDS